MQSLFVYVRSLCALVAGALLTYTRGGLGGFRRGGGGGDRWILDNKGNGLSTNVSDEEPLLRHLVTVLERDVLRP